MPCTADKPVEIAEKNYAQIAKIMQALSDPKRLLIVDILSCGECCATELQKALSMTQPMTSYHMKLLADAGVITLRNEGKYVFYSLLQSNLRDFMQAFLRLTESKAGCVCNIIHTEP